MPKPKPRAKLVNLGPTTTVKTLIAKLQQFPQDAEITVNFVEDTGHGSRAALDGELASLFHLDDEPDVQVVVMSVACVCSECLRMRELYPAPKTCSLSHAPKPN